MLIGCWFVGLLFRWFARVLVCSFVRLFDALLVFAFVGWSVGWLVVCLLACLHVCLFARLSVCSFVCLLGGLCACV